MFLGGVYVESFGCWYKLQNNSCTEENDTSKLENRAPVPDFDLHVNFWFLAINEQVRDFA